MKILITADLYDTDASGNVSSVKVLKAGLEAAGHDVKVLTLSDTSREKKKGNVFYISSFDSSFIYPNTRIGLPKINRLVFELIAWQPDIIHANCELSSFAAACFIRRKLKKRIPVILTYHTIYKEYLRYVRLDYPLIRKIILPHLVRVLSRKLDAFIAPTVKVRKALLEAGVKTDIHIIPSGLNDRFFGETSPDGRTLLRTAYGIREDECLLLYLGRIAKEKNIEELLRYLTSDRLRTMRLMIAGDGPDRAGIEKYAIKLGIRDRIIFTGMIKPEDVPGYYKAADIFVSASTSETQGLTYAEAMACSLPVVLRYDPCIDGVIENGINGFSYHTKKGFVTILSGLARNPALRKKIGERGRLTAQEKYTSEKMIQSCEKVYAGYLKPKYANRYVRVYTGGYHLIKKSGVGRAILHQISILKKYGIPVNDVPLSECQIVHINTVFPDSVLTAVYAKLKGIKVIWYGHSTMEDFRNSFTGSDFFAPAFKRWITFCYSLGDVIITPTEYSKRLLKSYGIKKPIYALTNGIDTDFWRKERSPEKKKEFLRRYNIPDGRKLVMSVGHFMKRKGLPEYIELAKEHPDITFLWFGHTDTVLVSAEIRHRMRHAPENLVFAGFVSPKELRTAYSFCDAFVFLSHEETEGIVVLEALACEIPTILRDIPVYEGRFENKENVYKIKNRKQLDEALSAVLSENHKSMTKNARLVTERLNLTNTGSKLMQIYER